jgi:hypothetical protein
LKNERLKMATQRQYEPFTLFNVRIVDMRHLWTASDTYKGQKQQKASYFAGFIVAKTQAQWHLEPGLAGLTAALGKIYANNPQIIDWRISDGDMPNADGKSSEFAKGHWLFNASSENAINVELAQQGGALVKLQNKVGVKSGDYCMIGGTAAVSGQNNRAAKLYLNAVVFSAPGEEIVFANSVTGAELMRTAEAQGLRPVGFGAAPGGFGGGQPQGGGFSQPGTGSAHGGSFGNPAIGTAPGLGGTSGNGSATFPSNQGGPGFPAPQQQNFAPPNPGGALTGVPSSTGHSQSQGGFPGGGFPGR